MLTVVAIAGCSSCAPLNPSAQDVLGRWQVQCEGGTETLELSPQGRYTYTAESPRRKERAPPICEDAAARTGSSRRGHTQLAPVWEWGHAELSFHPDLGGFRRATPPNSSADQRLRSAGLLSRGSDSFAPAPLDYAARRSPWSWRSQFPIWFQLVKVGSPAFARANRERASAGKPALERLRCA